MFDQLFGLPQVLARHRAGPLREERLAFLAHLADQGYSRNSLRRKARGLLAIATSLRLAGRPGEKVTCAEIKRKAVARTSCLSLATEGLQFLGRLQPRPAFAGPYAEKLQAFADYMGSERGLSPSTIRDRCWLVPRVLNRLGTAGGSLRAVTPDRIDKAFQGLLRQGTYTPTTIQDWASALRSFFRYAEMRGWCREGLAASIRGPRVFSQAALPTGPSWDDVRRLLATTEGDHAADIRDRAILMLLANYGLRAGEVSRLRLHDLDWDREQFTVASSKSLRPRVYPLTRGVGDAVLRYLKEVRPRSLHREVFLTLLAPIRPLHRALYGIVARRMRTFGLAIPHQGPHALRHACAARLLSQGLSLKEIGDHLGHLDPETTRIYAKVDLVGLRQVADFDLGGLR
jgi:site-specific recombinase XerD